MHWIKEKEEVLAACDEELMGKELETKEKTVKIKKEFYKGRKVEKKELRELINKHENINLIGKNTVETAKKEIENLHVKKIQGIPHSMIFTINKK